jgi:hypothetical protein
MTEKKNAERRLSPVEAVAEAWASMDGKLDEFRATDQWHGHRDGYLAEAHELIERVRRRGWILVPACGEGGR